MKREIQIVQDDLVETARELNKLYQDFRTHNLPDTDVAPIVFSEEEHKELFEGR